MPRFAGITVILKSGEEVSALVEQDGFSVMRCAEECFDWQKLNLVVDDQGIDLQAIELRDRPMLAQIVSRFGSGPLTYSTDYPAEAVILTSEEGLRVRVRVVDTDDGPLLTLEGLGCDLEGEEPGAYYLKAGGDGADSLLRSAAAGGTR